MQIRRAIVSDNLATYLTGKPHQHKNQTAAQHSKILDFGCGSGLFVEELAQAGFDSYGIDISSEAIKFGQLRGIKNLSVIDSHKIDFPNNTFDAVLTLDVLEHLEDTEWALAEMERVLKPGGVVVVMVPAYMFLWGVQDEVAHHYRRYTWKLLSSEIRRATSLSIIRHSYFNTILFTPIALVRLLSRLFRIRGRESDFDLNSPLLNKILFGIFNFERKLLKKMNFPLGVSVLAVLRKG